MSQMKILAAAVCIALWPAANLLHAQALPNPELADFEDGMDGVKPYQPSTQTLTLDPTTASHGAQSLLVQRTSGNAWLQTVDFDPLNLAPFDQQIGSLTLEWDAEATGGNGTGDVPSGWLGIWPVENTATGGFQQGPQNDVTLDGKWHTYFYALPNSWSTAAGSYQQLYFVTDTNDTSFQFHIDNIRVIAGDIDGNGVVDGNDLAILNSFYGQSVSGLGFDGDLNGDGTVNNDDVSLFMWDLAEYNSDPGAGFPVTAAPEPAALAIGLLPLLALRIRNRHRK